MALQSEKILVFWLICHRKRRTDTTESDNENDDEESENFDDNEIKRTLIGGTDYRDSDTSSDDKTSTENSGSEGTVVPAKFDTSMDTKNGDLSTSFGNLSMTDDSNMDYEPSKVDLSQIERETASITATNKRCSTRAISGK
ncbi:unnamed protein product [Hermetia illucens]|uniref:Uncharacterized protein n=1 Tax=Hermetia illucens TaxID=343691 RepID=A0A7R8UGV2_HERIL|nr:unnamed protein product [Hermetia illucens]